MAKRALSFWGWGYADRFPDDDTRAALAQQLEMLLGFTPLEIETPVAVDKIDVPEPRIQIPRGFKVFSSDHPVNRAAHTYGKSYRDILRGMRGDFAKAPDFIVYPRHSKDIEKIMSWCNEEGVALVPFGGGTSVVGGVECSGRPHKGVVCMDMRGLNKVLDVDHTSMVAHIQAGATGPQIEEQLGTKGLTLRHYPQSFEFSTLGGWIATRSGGHFATRYTRIDDLLMSVSMVTPRGEFVTRDVPSSGAGPDPRMLALGSEGALGVITDAKMRVRTKPRFRASATVAFEEWNSAVSAVREIAQARLYPSQCRLLDKREATLAQLPNDNKHVLLLDFESSHRPVNQLLDDTLQLTGVHMGETVEGPYYRSQGEKAPNSGIAGRWRQSFFEAPYLHTTLISMGVIVDTFETSVSWDKFHDLHADIVRSVRSAIQRVCGQKGLVTCRFTHIYPDGPAPQYTVMAPARRGEETDQWAEIRWAAADALIRNGASITHHHGVGRLHRPWYDKEVPEPFTRALRATKGALDPRGILNPGALIDSAD